MTTTALTALALALAAIVRPTHVLVPLGEPLAPAFDAGTTAQAGSGRRGATAAGFEHAPSATDLEFARIMDATARHPASPPSENAKAELTQDLERIHTRPAALVGLTPGWDLSAPAPAGDPWLPPSAVRQVVRENYGRLQECLAPALRNNPAAAERLKVQFVVDKRGRVAALRMASPRLTDPGALGCVARVFDSLRFAPPHAGPLVVSYPLRVRAAS